MTLLHERKILSSQQMSGDIVTHNFFWFLASASLQPTNVTAMENSRREDISSQTSPSHRTALERRVRATHRFHREQDKAPHGQRLAFVWRWATSGKGTCLPRRWREFAAWARVIDDDVQPAVWALDVCRPEGEQWRRVVARERLVKQQEWKLTRFPRLTVTHATPCVCTVEEYHAPCHNYSERPLGTTTTAGWRDNPLVWLVAHDLVPRGPTPKRPSGEYSAWGVPISFHVVLTHRAATLGNRLTPHACDGCEVGDELFPVVLWHGTTNAIGSWATKPRCLQACKAGMLGPGVYLGSFWKAVRFAVATQDFTPRTADAAHLLRVLAFPKRCKHVWSTAEDAVDRDGGWRAAFDAVCVRPRRPSRHVQGTIRNEEWCCNVGILEVVGAARVDPRTEPAPPRNPWWRFSSVV